MVDSLVLRTQLGGHLSFGKKNLPKGLWEFGKMLTSKQMKIEDHGKKVDQLSVPSLQDAFCQYYSFGDISSPKNQYTLMSWFPFEG